MQTLTAKNIGFIAKLNGLERLPSKDKKLWQYANEGKLGHNPQYLEIVIDWKAGWDSANNEYKKYNRKSKN